MSTTSTARPETLVAIDIDREGASIAPVLEFIGDALIHHREGTTLHWWTGEPLVTHWVTFDARRVRNTAVHGAGFLAGFATHIEAPTLAGELAAR